MSLVQFAPRYGATILAAPPSPDMIDRARKLALASHEGQRYGVFPYSYHLTAVAGLTSIFTDHPEVISAAWLHDVIEDCPDIDLEVVESLFGTRVASVVDLLTDPKGPRSKVKPEANRRAASTAESALIKLADRYCNHASVILEGNVRLAEMYFHEFDGFMMEFYLAGRENMPLYRMVSAQRTELMNLLGFGLREQVRRSVNDVPPLAPSDPVQI